MKKILKHYEIIIVLSGILLIIIKSLSKETIDSDGILHESFYLLPIGFFLIFLGIIIYIIKLLKNHH